MKSINELRKGFTFNASECSSSIKYFKTQNIDWDVFLPTRNKNLQRDFVWDIYQKRELINSILIGRHIPHLSFINLMLTHNPYKDVFQIIDGKQRLSTFFDFIDNKFTILIEEKEHLFSELPKDYQQAITNYYFRYYIVNDEHDKVMTDDEKINWFKFINFAGTLQDKQHLDSL